MEITVLFFFRNFFFFEFPIVPLTDDDLQFICNELKSIFAEMADEKNNEKMETIESNENNPIVIEKNDDFHNVIDLNDNPNNPNIEKNFHSPISAPNNAVTAINQHSSNNENVDSSIDLQQYENL